MPAFASGRARQWWGVMASRLRSSSSESGTHSQCRVSLEISSKRSSRNLPASKLLCRTSSYRASRNGSRCVSPVPTTINSPPGCSTRAISSTNKRVNNTNTVCWLASNSGSRAPLATNQVMRLLRLAAASTANLEISTPTPFTPPNRWANCSVYQPSPQPISSQAGSSSGR